jgi:hypothetical protein
MSGVVPPLRPVGGDRDEFMFFGFYFQNTVHKFKNFIACGHAGKCIKVQ